MTSYVPINLAYNTFEPESGIDVNLLPVFFLHGAGASKENWNDLPQIVANETKRKVYALDARNHGDSEWSDSLSFDVNVKDLFYFMDSMSVDKGVVIGHSMGGVTGIKAALEKPERVEKLIVEDMFVKKIPQPVMSMATSFTFLATKAAEALPAGLTLKEAQMFIFKNIYDSLPEEFKKDMKAMKSLDPEKAGLQMKLNSDGKYVLKANMEVIIKAVTNVETHMSDPEGIYEGPACFIYGEKSPFRVGDEVSHIRQFFPNAEFVCIEDATHAPHLEKTKEFTEAVVKFLVSE